MGFGQQFLLMQRVKEISMKGTSKISLPKSSSMRAPGADKLQVALPQIQQAICKQEEELRGLALHINHTSRLAERLFQKGDITMTVATMRKVKSIQQQFIHGLRVVAALKEYESYIQMGQLGMKHVAKDLDAIQSAPCNNKSSSSNTKKFNDTEIMSLVAGKQFFPSMDESTGAISFSEHSPFSGSEPAAAEANRVVTSAA